MQKTVKYIMIVTEEDERYDQGKVDVGFFTSSPWEGRLSDIVYGDNAEELITGSDGRSNEGLFYQLYAMEEGAGCRIGYGIIDIDALTDDIASYERKKNIKQDIDSIGDVLTVFDINEDCGEKLSESGRFMVTGTCELCEEKDVFIPEFTDIEVKKLIDGSWTEYHPTGVSFSGHRFDEEDVINAFLDYTIQGSNAFNIIYLNDELKRLVEAFQKIISIESNVSVPKKILDQNCSYVMELNLVTDKYIYYCYENLTKMFDRNMKLLSDNYFAEEAFAESTENIVSGKEQLIWAQDYVLRAIAEMDEEKRRK